MSFFVDNNWFFSLKRLTYNAHIAIIHIMTKQRLVSKKPLRQTKEYCSMQTLNFNTQELKNWVADVLKHTPIDYLELPRDKDSERKSKDRSYCSGSADVDVLTDRIVTYSESKLLFDTSRNGYDNKQLQVQTKVIKRGDDRIQDNDETIIQLTALTDMDLKKPSNTILGS